MGIFGWSLPPGVSIRDIDPPEQPCDVCGHFSDTCICPECPVCQHIGDSDCYAHHGLVLTQEQIESRAKRTELDLDEETRWINSMQPDSKEKQWK